jgi:hypothetical protein
VRRPGEAAIAAIGTIIRQVAVEFTPMTATYKTGVWMTGVTLRDTSYTSSRSRTSTAHCGPLSGRHSRALRIVLQERDLSFWTDFSLGL